MTGGGRRFKPARGWEREGENRGEREDASRLFVCSASWEGGEELPGERGAPGRSDEGERRKKPAGKFSGSAPSPAATPLAAPAASSQENWAEALTSSSFRRYSLIQSSHGGKGGRWRGKSEGKQRSPDSLARSRTGPRRRPLPYARRLSRARVS